MTNRQDRLAYARAVQRVGETPAAQLLWALAFAGSDLSADAHRELNTFFEVKMAQAAGYDVEADGFPSAPARLDLPQVPGGRGVPKADAEVIHRELRRQVRNLREDGTCSLDTPASATLFWNNPTRTGRRRSDARGKPWHMLVMRQAGPVPMFFGWFLDLLLAVGSALRLCAASGCERMFIASRTHQTHCSVQGTNRTTQARFRAKHQDGAARRRDQRQRQQKRRRAEAAGITPGRVGTIRKRRSDRNG